MDSAASSVYSSVADEAARLEAVAWSKFTDARDSEEFCASWLAILCGNVPRVTAALLILGPDPDGGYTPAAVWPDPSRNVQYLGPVAENVLKERKGVIVPSDRRGAMALGTFVGYPIEVAGALHGAVILDIPSRVDGHLQAALRQIHWASAWLIDRFRQRALTTRQGQFDRTAQAVDVAAVALHEPNAEAAAIGIVNELAMRLSCQRVSLGFINKRRIKLAVISHIASFDPRMNLVRLIEEAMDETIDADETVLYPPNEDEQAMAHRELARESQDCAICSVRVLDGSRVIGALVFERSSSQPFDAETINLCETVGGLIGPILELKRSNEKSLVARNGRALLSATGVVVGRSHPGAKLIILLLAAAVAALVFIRDIYRVPARAVIEGQVQRAAVAPFEGHIAEAPVRAGERVKAGQMLSRLDDREIRLEHARLGSEREQLVRKQRQALAAQERGTLLVLAAQIAQVDAQLALTADKLERATVRAPIDGIVVTGDLSQLLGTPVEQGKLLFQIAPMDAYRIALDVDERDIALVSAGQRGQLTVTGLPDERMAFVVDQVIPVAKAQDGRNIFRVEARLDVAVARLRPGMEGVGKIDTEERRLIWIWTRGMVDWFRTMIWKLMP